MSYYDMNSLISALPLLTFTHTDLVIGVASTTFINIWKDSFEEEFLCSLNCLFLLYWAGWAGHNFYSFLFQVSSELRTAVRILKSDQLLSSSQHRVFCKIELEKISDIWRFYILFDKTLDVLMCLNKTKIYKSFLYKKIKTLQSNLDT